MDSNESTRTASPQVITPYSNQKISASNRTISREEINTQTEIYHDINNSEIWDKIGAALNE